MTVHCIDTLYTGQPGVASAYLMIEGREAAFVETNTAHAVPRLLAALEANGLSPEAVRYIIITHIHLDHAGGAGVLLQHCPNATLLAHPKAAPHAIDPSKLIKSARAVYGDDVFDELYGQIEPVPEQRVRILEDGETLTWGSRTLTFLHTRGHANHHFVIHDSHENGVFVGDAFGIGYPAAQAGGRWVFPSSSPTDFDAEAAIDSVHRIVKTGADKVWLTHHDVRTDVAEVAAELEAELVRYGALVDEADATGLEGDALDAFVAKRVDGWFDEGLRARGLEDDEHVRSLVSLDRDLNGQGIAFAVKKRRYKRSKA